MELLKGGGTASGPVSFMRGADASAGTIKSGGKTRRAAKMVILNVDHPDIEEFIWCKAREEKKVRVLEDAGFDMGLDGTRHATRPVPERQQLGPRHRRVHAGRGRRRRLAPPRRHRRRGRAHRQGPRPHAPDLPGRLGVRGSRHAVRHHDQPLAHGRATPGRINGSNPCSEYMHLDNSACNLARLNLLKFLETPDDRFDVDGFSRPSRSCSPAQEILVGKADYPTEPIAETSRRFRQLGLGYANLGALLMALGLPYDSDAGRAWASALTALMTGHAYVTSARTAGRMGPFTGYADNREHMLRVLNMHREAAPRSTKSSFPPRSWARRRRAWDEACDVAEINGVRNSQASVLAPTGTIGLLMDCDTTGLEPDLGLVKTKKLVGGGTMSIVNQTVPRALRRLGYDDEQVAEIVAHIDEHKSILGAPHLLAEHVPVFACSMGDYTIHYTGHVRMMAAIQPWISGAHQQDRQLARGGDGRGGRAAPHRCVAPRHQGRRHLPRQLQGRAATVHVEEGARRAPPSPSCPRWSSE